MRTRFFKAMVFALLILTFATAGHAIPCYTFFDYYIVYYGPDFLQPIGYEFCLCGGQKSSWGSLAGSYRERAWERCSAPWNETVICEQWTGSSWEPVPCP